MRFYRAKLAYYIIHNTAGDTVGGQRLVDQLRLFHLLTLSVAHALWRWEGMEPHHWLHISLAAKATGKAAAAVQGGRGAHG